MSEEGDSKQSDPPIFKKQELADLYIYKLFDGPATWFYENIAAPLRAKNKYPYYHRRFKRVATIDECEVDDMACVYEANEQYKRDKKVDMNIMRILRQRFTECHYWEGPDSKRKCLEIKEQFLDASTNYFVKYGDLGYNTTVLDALMKQKHRMIWERRKEAENGGN